MVFKILFYISVYTNHRPAFGLQADKLAMAFELLGFDTDAGMAIDRGDLLDFLQSKGVKQKILLYIVRKVLQI